ncbi:DNA-directed RNA polymerase II subunit RPB4 [Acrasis kona]|uniref:DNA-directed RNA polymerase II subunit RPB4 n=1 Tax=Acrasis kona TaxID=1008807 RepID=A0AAW2YXQ1_9EUKA
MATTEDASELNFGEDFDKAECLSCAEVSLLLKDKRDQMNDGINDVFEKALKYVNQFGGNQNSETIKEIRKLGQRQQLHQFEIASLANLAIGDLEEAKTLLPSLKRYTDEAITDMLNDLTNLKEI